ncbi:DUF4241 domain-containing protein [Streptomyces hiroshimensis]|uniref:DUF4241 domain-containing protein n=1 Tax=Streptomyces hiroshimensis TaxID=66424 RepID=A0ABQ2Z9V5_9ACTN|nr:DUF4241 domain-containing protein [Streptomyces hiroshimensis]GGY06666.1 hypothetical protein GCM10010324_61810 [Streptomyces hiroshimensis]
MTDQARTAIQVTYGEQWDFATLKVVGALTRSQAEERDAAGLPYVVVFGTAGRTTPVEVQLTSWADHYLGAWAYDEHGRRICEFDLRLLDDTRLLIRHAENWEYDAPDMPEFAAHCRRTTVDLYPDGRAQRMVSPFGSDGTTVTRSGIGDEQRWLDRPAFGQWVMFSAAGQGLAGRLLTYEDAQPATGNSPQTAVDAWRPPRTRPPLWLDALFRPGTRLSTALEPLELLTVLEPRPVGTVRVPSGRIVVDCPVTGGGRELTVSIPSGEYLVDTARTGYTYEFMGKQVEAEDMTAVRLRVSDEPAVRWEMGLGAGEDVRLLRDGHAYGFSTDTATGGFADAVAWPVLAGLFRQALQTNATGPAEQLSDGFLRTTDESLNADLMAFPTGGDGTYAVWVGRGRSGEVTAIVVQAGYLHDVQVL